jgi:hypothetical protein
MMVDFVFSRLIGGGAQDGMIWIPHPEEGYLPGKVSRDCGDGSCEVTTNEGEARAPTNLLTKSKYDTSYLLFF